MLFLTGGVLAVLGYEMKNDVFKVIGTDESIAVSYLWENFQELLGEYWPQDVTNIRMGMEHLPKVANID